MRYLFLHCFGFILGALLIPSSAHALVLTKTKPFPVLPACTKFEHDLFEDIDFEELNTNNPDAVDTARDLVLWKNIFHTTAKNIIDNDLGRLVDNPLNSPLRITGRELSCTARDYTQFIRPSLPLRNLAEDLPSWESSDALNRLTQLDVGQVLLEYLRMYECALVERESALTEYTSRQEARRKIVILGLPVDTRLVNIRLEDHTKEIIADRETIEEEIQDAREIIHKAIGFIGSLHRYRALDAEINCLQQASLDIRNALALAADAVSCLPRTWGSRDVLRDFAPMYQELEE